MIEREEILSKSPLLQRSRERSLQVIEAALEVYEEADSEESFRKKIFKRHKEKFGSTIGLTILLQVIVPLVAKLIIAWWLERKKEEPKE